MIDSFEQFYLASADRTYKAAWRRARNDDIAKEATDEAYAVMLDQWDKRQQVCRSKNQAYVIGIALHKVVDWFRWAERFVPLSDEDDRGAEDEGYDHLLDHLSLTEEVRRVLAGRSVVSEQVGILYFLEGCTPSEIAEVLGMAPSTVRTHVQRLREVLRSSLLERMGWLDGRRYRDGS